MRAIDISAQAAIAPPDPGPVPDLVWLPLDRLRIDDAYQRPLQAGNWRTVRRIAAAFHWSRFTPIMAAPLGPDLWAVIDGQHRCHAAALAGIDRVPAFVSDLPMAEQARAFADINSVRTGMSPLHMLRAALASGEGWAVAAAREVAAAECRLMTYNSSFANRRAGEIYAVALIREHVTAGRAKVVRRGLAALRGSALADDPALYQARILRPWLSVLAAEPGLMQLDLEAFVGLCALPRLRDAASALRRTPEYAGLTDNELAVRAIGLRLRRAARDKEIGLAGKVRG